MFIALVMRFVPLLKTFHFIFDTLSNYDMRSIYTPANNLFMAEFIFFLMQFPILRVVFDVQKWRNSMYSAIIY